MSRAQIRYMESMRILRSHRARANARRRALLKRIVCMVEWEAHRVMRRGFAGVGECVQQSDGHRNKEIKQRLARTSQLAAEIRHSLHVTRGEGLILAFVIQAAGFALGMQNATADARIVRRKARQFSAKLAGDLIRAGLVNERLTEKRSPRPMHLRSTR